MKVYLITEGGSDIGIGHITRCTALYEAFEEKGILPLFLINGNETVKDLLKSKNYEIFNWLAEEKKLLTFIEHADVVIIDSYRAVYDLYEKISGLAEVPVYIDDNRRIDYPGGFIINGTIYAEDLNYPKRKDVTYLLGSKYIPLRKEFWDVPEKEIKKNIQTVMVTFGGDDARNMTPGILNLLKENFPKLIKKVIIGKGFKNIERIESLKNGKTELIYYPNAEDMKRVMLESDIAISASGQTLYELARVGVPTIAIAVAENQMNNAKGWQKAGFIEYAGWWEDKNTLNAIASKIKLLRAFDLRKEKSTMGRCYVDGLGASRVVELVTNVKL
jgi:UDP-2,4-diacetamido-2,4,6-trideoxy-beta-L-altropyranose hydrolase